MISPDPVRGDCHARGKKSIGYCPVGRERVPFCPVKWHVLHIKPRREKKVAEFCKLADLDHYLPLRQETKIYQRRRVTVNKCVFPGYVFCRFDEPGRLQLLKTNNLVRILEPPNEAELVRELEQIRTALAVDPTLGSAKALHAGRFVRITGGPFRGIEGKIETLKGRSTVCLNVDMIGQAVRVQVDREFLELAE